MKKEQKLIFRLLPLLIAAVIAALLPQMIRNEYYMTIACQILIYLIAVCGLNFITGLTGQMNLGTAGMFAMGAYVSGLLNVKLGVSPWLGLVAALCVGWLIGKALGYPSLRLRGVYLSLTTIAFTEIIRMLLNNMKGITNGAQGLRGIERYNFFGYRVEGTIPYYYMVLIVAILVVWFAWRIVNSKWGREFKAVRDNIDAVESCGIDVAKVKIRAFTLAAMLGSFAGALYAHLIGYINPESFTVDLSTNFVIMLMVGGIGSVFGNVIGAVIITLLPELLRFLGKYYYFVYYTAVLLCALFLPKGIVSLAAPIREKWNRLRARRAGAPAMEKGGTADGDHIKN